MPNIWTHIHFANKLAANMNLDHQQYAKVYKLAAQGPDPFFYYSFWSSTRDSDVNEIGSRIHKKHCGRFLLEMLSYVKEKQDPMLIQYMYGFMAHHILDRNAHPYIIYKSGEKDNKHQVLETTIDTLIMEEFHQVKAWKRPVYKEVDVGSNLPAAIQELLLNLLQEIHQERRADLQEKINKSYRYMILGLKVLYDPTGLKNKLLGKRISPYSHHKNIPERDYLNKEHNEWLHPTDKNEVSRESFYDILRRAEAEGNELFRRIDGYLNNKSRVEDVKEVLKDISYETGKPCSLDLELKYFDPIV